MSTTKSVDAWLKLFQSSRMVEGPNLSGYDFHMIVIGKIETWIPGDRKFNVATPEELFWRSHLC